MLEQRDDWGTVRFKLEEYMQKNQISKSKLAKKAELQYTQLQAYYNNEILRPDLSVLARICFILRCDLNDIIEYIPPEK